MSRSALERAGLVSGLGLGAAIFGINLYFFAPYGIGDGFITARYAENLVDYGEIAFNRGEHVSAITSPLHMLFLSLLYGIGGDIVVLNKILSAVCVFSGALIFSWNFIKEPVTFLLSLYLGALSPFLILWTFSGLETAYVFAAVAVFCSLMIRAQRNNKDRFLLVGIGLIASLLFLLRFETVLLTVPACLYLVQQSDDRVRDLSRIAAPALTCAGWLVFSYFYFGDVLPTSFYLKTPSYGARMIGANGLYILQFLLLSGLWTILLFPRAGLTVPPVGRVAPSAPWWIPLALALLCVYWLGAATKHMMYGYRIFLPYLPFLFLIFYGVSKRFNRGHWNAVSLTPVRLSSFLLLGAIQMLLCLTVYYVSLNPSLVGEFRKKGAIAQMAPGARDQTLMTVEALRAHWRRYAKNPSEAPRLFTREAGFLPYYFRESVVLDQGLISQRHNCKYDIRQSADYIVVWFPAWGALEHQLPKPAAELELVVPDRLPATGIPYEAFFFNPKPAAYRLPRQIAGDCIDRSRADKP